MNGRGETTPSLCSSESSHRTEILETEAAAGEGVYADVTLAARLPVARRHSHPAPAFFFFHFFPSHAGSGWISHLALGQRGAFGEKKPGLMDTGVFFPITFMHPGEEGGGLGGAIRGSAHIFLINKTRAETRYLFSSLSNFFSQRNRDRRQVRHPLWCFPPQGCEEAGGFAALQVFLRFLRQVLGEAHRCGYLEMRLVPQGQGGWCLHAQHLCRGHRPLHHPPSP